MSEDLRDWSTKDLIEEYLGLYDAIYNVGCYSTSDYLLFCAIEDELLRRGCSITPSVEVEEPEED